MKKKKELFIVSSDILPEAIIKTAQAKELILKGEAMTVHEAVEKVGLSRSAFYKYKDGINPYNPEDTVNTQFYVIDGFICSPNVQIDSVNTVDAQFQYSDHNPVALEISLLPEN